MASYLIQVEKTPEFSNVQFNYSVTEGPDFMLGYLTGVFSLIGNSDELTDPQISRDSTLSHFNKEIKILKQNRQLDPLKMLKANKSILEDSDEVPDLQPSEYRRRYGRRWEKNYLVYLQGPKNNMIVQYDHPDFISGVKGAYTDFGLEPSKHIRDIVTKQ